jgi:hypothetical protein
MDSGSTDALPNQSADLIKSTGYIAALAMGRAPPAQAVSL